MYLFATVLVIFFLVQDDNYKSCRFARQSPRNNRWYDTNVMTQRWKRHGSDVSDVMDIIDVTSSISLERTTAQPGTCCFDGLSESCNLQTRSCYRQRQKSDKKGIRSIQNPHSSFVYKIIILHLIANTFTDLWMQSGEEW